MFAVWKNTRLRREGISVVLRVTIENLSRSVFHSRPVDVNRSIFVILGNVMVFRQLFRSKKTRSARKDGGKSCFRHSSSSDSEHESRGQREEGGDSNHQWEDSNGSLSGDSECQDYAEYHRRTYAAMEITRRYWNFLLQPSKQCMKNCIQKEFHCLPR